MSEPLASRKELAALVTATIRGPASGEQKAIAQRIRERLERTEPDPERAATGDVDEVSAEMRAVSGGISSVDPLVCLLYVLARDHAPVGVVERAADTALRVDEYSFSNGWLASWAAHTAARLHGETRP